MNFFFLFTLLLLTHIVSITPDGHHDAISDDTKNQNKMYIPSKYVIKLVSGLEENVKTQLQNSTISIVISKLSIVMKA